MIWFILWYLSAFIPIVIVLCVKTQDVTVIDIIRTILWSFFGPIALLILGNLVFGESVVWKKKR